MVKPSKDYISAIVSSHEELSDDANQLYTVYIVDVEKEVGGDKKQWTLKKRFSAFANLHLQVRLRYKELDDYVFPHKSMFNTFANFTKDRRKAGFNELLQRLVKIDPLPMELEDFLEIDDHINSMSQRPTFLINHDSKAPRKANSSSRSKSGKFDPNAPAGTPVRVESPEPGRDTRDLITSGDTCGQHSRSVPDVSPASTGGRPRNEGGGTGSGSGSGSGWNKDLMRIALTTLVVICIIYGVGVFTGLVDISTTTVGMECSVLY